jgi:predicted transcriptional regulator
VNPDRIVEALSDGSGPKTLGVLMQALRMPARAVLHLLAIAQSRGLVRNLGGQYTLAPAGTLSAESRLSLARELADLMAVVGDCEREWALDIRLASVQ